MQRRGGKRKRREGAGEVPVGSFSDIAFLLIIFFIIISSLAKTMGYQADVPSTEQDNNQQQEDQAPTISLSFSQIALDGTPVTLDELRERLAELKLAEKTEAQDRFIMLEAQAGAPYETFYQVWAAIVTAGGNVALLEADEGD